MSRQQSGWRGDELAIGARRRRYGRCLAITAALAAGLAACGGDDDDAADLTSAPETTGAGTTNPESTTPAEITAAHDTPATDGSTEPAVASSEPETAGTDGTPATPSTASGATDAPDAAAAAAASATSVDPGAGAGSAADVGPTTTGPACAFEENSSLPLERCDFGPAVAVLQSALQADGHAIDPVDGYFGDQTLYAVRAFQEAQGFPVDGIVGLQTWTALDVSQFGSDDDGDGVIEPGELDLAQQ